MKQALTRYLFNEYSRCKQRFWALINKDLEAAPMDQQAIFFKQQSSKIKDLAQELLAQKTNCSYERNKCLGVGEELSATVDFYETHHELKKTAIFEVRKSKVIKNHQLWDLAYLAYVFQKAGEPLRKIFIIHPNPNYVLGDEGICAEEALTIVDISRKVFRKLKKIEIKVKELLHFARSEAPSTSLAEHDCRSKDCLFIKKYHPNLPKHSVFDFKGINREQLKALLSKGILRIEDIPSSYIESDLQVAQRRLVESEQAIVDDCALKLWFSKLQYPLYFLDYEALSSALPVYPSTQAFQHLVFQYSLHRITAAGAAPEHFEYLPADREFPIPKLLESLKTHLEDNQGTVIVYHNSFEKARNREMARLCPQYADWLNKINQRIVDLEKLFMLGTGAYQDAGFEGKTSLKKVLPVLLPKAQHHSDLAISDGMDAAIQWFNYLQQPDFSKEKIPKMRKELLTYCKLDTLAMVQIFQFLKQLVEKQKVNS